MRLSHLGLAVVLVGALPLVGCNTSSESVAFDATTSSTTQVLDDRPTTITSPRVEEATTPASSTSTRPDPADEAAHQCVAAGWRSIDAWGEPPEHVVVLADDDDRIRLCEIEIGDTRDFGRIPHAQIGVAPVDDHSVIVVDFSDRGWRAWWLRPADSWSEVAPIENDNGDRRQVAGLRCADSHLVRSEIDPLAAEGVATLSEEVVGSGVGGVIDLDMAVDWMDAVDAIQLTCEGVLLAPPRRLSLEIAAWLVESVDGVVLPGDHIIDPVATVLAERNGTSFSLGVDLSSEIEQFAAETSWTGTCPFGRLAITADPPAEELVQDLAAAGGCASKQ